MKTATLFLLLLTLGSVSASAQEILDTSYNDATGERVLRIESTLPALVERVWAAFTTEKGLSSWIAPVVKLDLRVGGMLSTNYDKSRWSDGEKERRGTKHTGSLQRVIDGRMSS